MSFGVSPVNYSDLDSDSLARRSAPIAPMILKADRPKFLILTLGPCQVSCGSGEMVIYFQGSGEQALTFGVWRFREQRKWAIRKTIFFQSRQ